MLANAAGARGTRGNGRSRESNFPPPPQGEHEANHGKWGGLEAGRKGATPPPPRTSAAPRARIVPATCTPRGKGQQTRQQQPANKVATGWWWNVLAICVLHACHQRRGRRARRAPKGATGLNPPPPPTEREREEPKRAGRPRREERTKREPPPPRQVPRLVLASCSQRACSGGKATRGPLPPLTPTPSGRGRGRRGDGKGKWGGDTGVNTRPEGETGSRQRGHPAA